MKSKSLVIAAALVGGLFSTASAFTLVASDANAAASVKFKAPAPAKVIQPILLPPRHEGRTVTLAMTIDEAGKPRNVRVTSTRDQAPYERLLKTVSEWEFTPALKNGVPVSCKVILPLEIIVS